MTSDRRLPDWASAVAGMAPAILTVGLVLGVAAMCIVGPRRAQALPSYARQTGQQCAACHNGFPELTPYGRQFKLNGYTFGGGDPSAIPPISAMTVGGVPAAVKSPPGKVRKPDPPAIDSIGRLQWRVNLMLATVVSIGLGEDDAGGVWDAIGVLQAAGDLDLPGGRTSTRLASGQSG